MATDVDHDDAACAEGKAWCGARVQGERLCPCKCHKTSAEREALAKPLREMGLRQIASDVEKGNVPIEAARRMSQTATEAQSR